MNVAARGVEQNPEKFNKKSYSQTKVKLTQVRNTRGRI